MLEVVVVAVLSVAVRVRVRGPASTTLTVGPAVVRSMPRLEQGILRVPVGSVWVVVGASGLVMT